MSKKKMDVIKQFERCLDALAKVKEETERLMQNNRTAAEALDVEFARLERYHEKAKRILDL